MLKHEDMTLNFKDSSADMAMADACNKDITDFFVNGSFWDGSHGKEFVNKPKPEFNRLWRPIHRVIGAISNMEMDSIIVPNSMDATEESGEMLHDAWRNDSQAENGAKASEIATMEACIGGMGCTKIVAKFEDEENPDPNKQYLCREAIRGACMRVFFDAGSIEESKSDARWGWHLIRTNRKKIEEETGMDVVSFMSPASDWSSRHTFSSSKHDVYLAHYYEVVERKLTTYDFSLMMPLKLTAGDGIKDEMGEAYTRDDLKSIREMYREQMGEDAPATRRTVKYVEYALADGEKYLTKPQKMPFKRVPLFPRYGYYTLLPNGEEFYCGEVRKQRDLEMFHNYIGSSYMQIAASSQVAVPEYAPEQIARHASQRARADIENVAFVMSDPIKDASGNPVHWGPIGMKQPPVVGSGLQAATQFIAANQQSMDGMGSVTTPANVSGEAIQSVNERQDDAFICLSRSTMHALRDECLGWIPAAQSLYFTNSVMIRVQKKNGDYQSVTTLEMDTDQDGNYGPYKNNARGKYTVQVKEGTAYQSTIDSKIESNIELMAAVGSDTTSGQIIAYENMKLLNKDHNPMIESIAKYAPLDLIINSGYPYEPQDEEEAQYIQERMEQMQAQQQQAAQNDPMMVAAQAEQLKAQAQMLDKQVDQFNAETSRMKVMVDAEKVGADINFKQVDLQLKAMGQLGNMQGGM